MQQGLVSYEKEHGVSVNYRCFSIVITQATDLIGILNAYTAYSEIYIDDIWINKAYRKKGYGKLLLCTVEDKYKGKEFNNINLVTREFQAPDFYRKCGYTVEFVGG
jgi:ribosomal protein S18 acetylase RimI-like enzyme